MPFLLPCKGAHVFPIHCVDPRLSAADDFKLVLGEHRRQGGVAIAVPESVELLVQLIFGPALRPQNDRTTILAYGPPGSGKTTNLNYLQSLCDTTTVTRQTAKAPVYDDSTAYYPSLVDESNSSAHGETKSKDLAMEIYQCEGRNLRQNNTAESNMFKALSNQVWNQQLVVQKSAKIGGQYHRVNARSIHLAPEIRTGNSSVLRLDPANADRVKGIYFPFVSNRVEETVDTVLRAARKDPHHNSQNTCSGPHPFVTAFADVRLDP